MRKLPSAEVYEKEMIYLPWGYTINKVLEFCVKVPQNVRVLDVMCGTGHLLGKIAEQRKDLELVGVDADKRYIEFANKQYFGITFVESDVLTWEPDGVYDVILCTGALHHLAYAEQPLLLEKIRRWLNCESRSIFVLAENFLRDYSDEIKRQEAAKEYGRYYLAAAKANKAPPEIIKAVLSFMQNDVCGFEYKTSLCKMRKLLDSYFCNGFKKYEVIMFGDEKAQVGDYVIIFSNLALRKA